MSQWQSVQESRDKPKQQPCHGIRRPVRHRKTFFSSNQRTQRLSDSEDGVPLQSSLLKFENYTTQAAILDFLIEQKS